MNKVQLRHKRHNFNLSFFRSDFFSGLLNTNFREGAERSATLPLSKKAAEKFIRFLYGFELEEDRDIHIVDEIDIDIYKDLIAYGGVCGLRCLQDAAGETLGKYLSRNNVFELLVFAKQHNAEAALKICIDFVVENFSQTSLVENGHLARHPDIAVRICERQVENDNVGAYFVPERLLSRESDGFNRARSYSPPSPRSSPRSPFPRSNSRSRSRSRVWRRY